MRDFWFSCCFVFKPSALCLQWEFAGIKTGEKLLEFTRGTKGLLCRRIWRTRLLSLPLPSFLFSPCQRAPASSAGEGGLLPMHRGGDMQAGGWTPPVPAGSGSRALQAEGRSAFQTFTHRSVQGLPQTFSQASCSLPWLCPSHGRQGGLCSSVQRQHPKKSPKGRAGSAMPVGAPTRCSPVD